MLPVALVLLNQPLASPQTLLVAAASDLHGVERPLTEALAARKTRVRFTFGSSGLLANQIAAGAPFDVFLSADERRVRTLAAGGRLVPESVTVYAVGRLAVWSKSGMYSMLADLTAPQVRHVAIANPAHAPYGEAAREALDRAGLWERLQPRIVYAESVRQALEFAVSGNADAAITAWSLVWDRGARLVPENLHRPILQAGGVVARSGNREQARAVMRFLASGEGRKILTSRGFGPPPGH